MNKTVTPLILFSILLVQSHTAKTNGTQQPQNPLNITSTKELYEVVCPYHNFARLADLLEDEKTTKTPSNTQSALRLFCSTLKDNDVNAVEFNALLKQVAPQLKYHFAPQQTREITTQELRKETLMFLKAALSKLTWKQQERNSAWLTVKSISDQLNSFADDKIIIDEGALEDLFATLISRYGHCMKVNIADLPAACQKAMLRDIGLRASPSLLTRAPWPIFEPFHAVFTLFPLQLFRIHPKHIPQF